MILQTAWRLTRYLNVTVNLLGHILLYTPWTETTLIITVMSPSLSTLQPVTHSFYSFSFMVSIHPFLFGYSDDSDVLLNVPVCMTFVSFPSLGWWWRRRRRRKEKKETEEYIEKIWYKLQREFVYKSWRVLRKRKPLTFIYGTVSVDMCRQMFVPLFLPTTLSRPGSHTLLLYSHFILHSHVHRGNVFFKHYIYIKSSSVSARIVDYRRHMPLLMSCLI